MVIPWQIELGHFEVVIFGRCFGWRKRVTSLPSRALPPSLSPSLSSSLWVWCVWRAAGVPWLKSPAATLPSALSPPAPVQTPAWPSIPPLLPLPLAHLLPLAPLLHYLVQGLVWLPVVTLSVGCITASGLTPL